MPKQSENNKNQKNVRLRDKELYFRNFITWSFVTSSTPSFRSVDNGLFDVSGSAIFAEKHHLLLLGLLNSVVSKTILLTINPTMNIQIDDIKRIPIINSTDENIEVLTKVNLELSRNDWNSFEESWDFKRHPLISKFPH